MLVFYSLLIVMCSYLKKCMYLKAFSSSITTSGTTSTAAIVCTAAPTTGITGNATADYQSFSVLISTQF